MVKKRGQSEGTVFWREDRQRWCAVVSFGFEGSRRRRKYVYGKTREEVQRRKNALLYELDQGMSPAVVTTA